MVISEEAHSRIARAYSAIMPPGVKPMTNPAMSAAISMPEPV
jgi:hypothetical protein